MSEHMEEAGQAETSKPIWAIWHWELHWQILAGIVCGLGLGVLSGLYSTQAGTDLSIYAFLGDLFMRAMKMLIIPLIASSIVAAMFGIGQHKGFARMGLKTLLYYVSTSLIAVLIGLALVNTIRPGVGGVTKEELATSIVSGSAEQQQMEKIESKTAGRGTADIFQVIKDMVPENIIDQASTNSSLLGVITFCLLFGFFVSRLTQEQRKPQEDFWTSLHEVMIAMTMFVMRFAPIGVGFLIAKTTAESVLNDNFGERFYQLLKFALTVVCALAIHAFVVMPLILKCIARVSPMAHIRAMGPALLFAFSSASSASTLPVTMECVNRRARVSKGTTGFVLPLGATVNMDGTALYECVAVLFVCQIYGIPMDFGMQFLVVALALLTSIGVAGIPSASLVAIVIILDSVSHQMGVNIGYEAIAIILIFDRVLDMCRTAVNVWGDSCGAVVIAKSEGEDQVLQPYPASPGTPAHISEMRI